MNEKIQPLKLVSIIAALVLAVITSGCGSEQSSGGEQSPDIEQSSVSEQSLDSTSSSDAYAVARLDGESEPEYPVFHVGDTIYGESLLGKVLITCTKVEDDDSGMFFDYGENRKVIRAYFVIKNDSDYEEEVSYVQFKCKADGEECAHAATSQDPDEDRKTMKKNKDFLGETEIKPGKTKEGYVYFVVPKDYSRLELFESNLDAVMEVQ